MPQATDGETFATPSEGGRVGHPQGVVDGHLTAGHRAVRQEQEERRDGQEERKIPPRYL